MLQRAATLDMTNTVAQLSQVVGYRRRVAEEFMRGVDDEQAKILRQTIEYCDNEIKALLAIE